MVSMSDLFDIGISRNDECLTGGPLHLQWSLSAL